ncbi:MAG: hypothetical protein ABIE23_04930 [archaeon]
MKLFNEKAQEEAPFEVLIAVILMMFVIVTGLIVMTEVSQQKCVKVTEKKMEDLKASIEAVSRGGASSVDFQMDSCGKNEKFFLSRVDDPISCSQCIGSPEKCTLLMYRSDNARIPPKCVAIPFDLTFDGDGDYGCNKVIGNEQYELVDINPTSPKNPTSLIEKGHYQFYYRITNQVFTIICAYRKN